jgi:hypothetical protein
MRSKGDVELNLYGKKRKIESPMTRLLGKAKATLFLRF